MGRGKNLTEDEFNKLKMMQDAGLYPKPASQITGRDPSTVAKAYRSKTYEDYKAPRRPGAPKQQQLPVVPPDATAVILQNINDALLGIRDSLVEINDRLERVESRY